MKKILIVFVLTIIMLLTACSLPAQESIVAESSEMAVQAASTRNEFINMDMHVSTGLWGLLQTYTTCNNHFFSVESIPSGGIYLRDIDMLSFTEKSIGNINNPVIEDALGGISPINVNGQLVLIKKGATPIPAADFSGWESSVFVGDKDVGYKPIFSLKKNEMFSTSMMAYDCNDNLYCIVQAYDAEIYADLENTYLVRININSGISEILYEWKGWSFISIIGTYPEGLVIQTVDASTDIPMMAMELFSTYTNSLIETNLIWELGERSTAVDDQGHLYYCLDNKLYVYDFSSSEIILLDDNICNDFGDTEAILTGEVIDNHIIYSVLDSLCYYDLNSKQKQKLELYYTHDGVDERPVIIYGETESCFVVVTGMSKIAETYSDNQGSYTYERGYEQYAAIDKEDYWNSIPNYVDITSMM